VSESAAKHVQVTDEKSYLFYCGKNVRIVNCQIAYLWLESLNQIILYAKCAIAATALSTSIYKFEISDIMLNMPVCISANYSYDYLQKSRRGL